MSKSTKFSIEQWEFIRRLRNSGLSKEQVCQAFDDLERIERELDSLFHNSQNTSNENLLNLLQTQFNSTTDASIFSKSIQNFQLLMAKNIAALNLHQRLLNPASTSTVTTSSSSPSPIVARQTTSISNRVVVSPSTNNENVNSLNLDDVEDEIKELDDFRS